VEGTKQEADDYRRDEKTSDYTNITNSNASEYFMHGIKFCNKWGIITIIGAFD
jgi:hypothetical protein